MSITENRSRDESTTHGDRWGDERSGQPDVQSAGQPEDDVAASQTFEGCVWLVAEVSTVDREVEGTRRWRVGTCCSVPQASNLSNDPIRPQPVGSHQLGRPHAAQPRAARPQPRPARAAQPERGLLAHVQRFHDTAAQPPVGYAPERTFLVSCRLIWALHFVAYSQFTCYFEYLQVRFVYFCVDNRVK